MRDLLERLSRCDTRHRAGVVATVVETRGSVYRRAGARALFVGEGARRLDEQIGAVSGGCLEADLLERAPALIEADRAALVRYDTHALMDEIWGLGLGCNGEVELLLEPIAHWIDGEAPLARRWRVLEGERRDFALIATLGGGASRCSRWILRADGDVEALGHAQALPDALALRAREGLSEAGHAPRLERCALEGGERYTLEWHRAPTRLVVVGAGNDAIPMSAMASALEMEVCLFDDREHHLRAERFPTADHLITGAPARFSELCGVDGRTAVVLMSHRYARDRECLADLIEAGTLPAYLGLLGPRPRTRQLLTELAERGLHPSEALRDRMHFPIGLDIGAETPAEIALATLAEVVAATNARSAGPLRLSPGRMHPEDER